MIKAAIFDMDGLLIDSEPHWDTAKRKNFDSIGVKLSKAQEDDHRGRRISENIEHIFLDQPWVGPSQKEVSNSIVQDVIDLIKLKGRLKDGVIEAINLCNKLNIKLAVASSSPDKLIDVVLDTFDLRKHFNIVYSADNEEYGKPHPGVFISTAKLLSVPVQQCLVFEDAPSGVLAAKAAKMVCIAVPEANLKNDKYVQTADVILDSLSNLTEDLINSF